jgi:hypothetical protein
MAASRGFSLHLPRIDNYRRPVLTNREIAWRSSPPKENRGEKKQAGTMPGLL